MTGIGILDQDVGTLRHRYYDQQRLFWESFWQKAKPGYVLQAKPDSLVREIESLLDKEGVEKILELGCGDGRNLVFLLNNHFNVVGLDQSSAALRRSHENICQYARTHSFSLVQGSAEGTSFSPSSFDAIICIDFFNHVIDWNPVLKETQRLLRPGGLLIANPLSVSDGSYSSYVSTADVLATNLFIKKVQLESVEESLTLIMHYACREELKESFTAYFQFIRTPSEKRRIDPPHPFPFQQVEHEHVYWEIIARKV